MRTEILNRIPITTIRPEAKRRLLHVIEKLAVHAKTPVQGHWKTLPDDKLWAHVVSQVCVMGSAVPMETLQRSGNLPAFESALALSAISSTPDKCAYIEEQLSKFKATRFRNRAAQRLAAALVNPRIVQGSRVVLLNDLPCGGPDVIREELLRRAAFLFGRKSVSDLMITLGLSHDVIALDQRVVGLLNTHLGYNLKFSKLQANCSIYLSVEDCLRCVCKEANITLGQLDRTLFSFAGLSAVEYLINYDLSRSTIA